MRLLLSVLLLTLPTLANGIVVPDQNVPVRLTAHRVHAVIHDRAARVTVNQTFQNTAPRELEGTYLFPLPRGATISSFAMTMGGQMVRGEILDADKARSIYLSIVRDRKDPGLLEYCGSNLYRARVFPIPAVGTIEIELKYDHLLPEEGGAVEFQYPLGTERLNRAAVEQVVIDVEYDGESALKSVYSPSHPLDVIRMGDRAARVTYERSRTRPSHSLQIYFGRSRQDLGMSVLSHREEGEDGAFLAMLGYDAGVKPEKLLPREMIYVVDTSGSMGGDKMEQAQKALTEAVAMLRPQDSFTMIGFATEERLFRRRLVPATPENKVLAGRWIRAREAAGGTAIDGALKAALKIAARGKLPIIVLLTDGRPTIGARDAKTILKNVAANNAAQARVFTFGIGSDLDVQLLDRIAEATRGKRDYIAPHESIGTVTRRFFRRIDQPVAYDVVLEASDGLREIYPRRIGDLFAADQIVVLGRYEESGAATITLRGMRGDKPFVRKYEFNLTRREGNKSLPRIWAQRKVAFLWDQMRLHGRSKELKDEIVQLGTRYSILTPYTSGLVVEGRSSASPLFFTSRDSNDRGRRRRDDGLKGGVPPGLRSPSDPEAPRAPATPPTGGPRGPTSPGSPMELSKRLQALKEEGRLHLDGDRVVAGDKTFRWEKNSGWLDAAWDGKGEPIKVVAFSDAYFELVALDPTIARYLAIGKWLTFVHDEKTYRVQPE